MIDPELGHADDFADRPSASRRLPSLVRELAQGSASLVRSEARLMRLELGDLLEVVVRGSIRVAIGSVFLCLGALALLVGLVFLIGEQWIVGRYWLAALIVVALTGAVAAVSATRGARLLSFARLRPTQTLETLKEDVEWLTRQKRNRSGATLR